MSTQSQTFIINGTFTAPASLSGGVVNIVATGGDTDSAAGGTVTATIPLAPGAQLTITIGQGPTGETGGTGYHAGGNAAPGGVEGGAGSTGVVRTSGGAVEIEAGGAGGAGAYADGGDGGGNGTPNADSPGGGTSGTGGGNGTNGTGSGGGGGGGNGPGFGGGTLDSQIYGGGGGGGASKVAADATGISYQNTYEGTARPAAVVITYTVSDVPLAPTLVSPNGAYLDAAAAGVALVGTYNPGTDPLALVQARFSIDGAAYQYWNGSSLVGSPAWFAPTTGVGATAGQQFSVVIPSGELADGHTDAWNLATQDSAGLSGPFAATDFLFYANVQPTVVITTPSGVQITTAPIASFTETLGGGDSQLTYRGVVYTLAQTLLAGFSPGVTTGVFDTGVVSSAALSFSITGLSNATSYVLYVQITETGPLASAWASSAFSVLLDSPAVPALVVVPTVDPEAQANGNPANQLNVVENDNLLSAVDASLETGIGTWTAPLGTVDQTAGVSGGSGWAVDGTKALRVRSVGAGAYAPQTNERIPVTPGATVWAWGVFHAPTTPQTISLVVYFYNGSNVFISALSACTAIDSSAPAGVTITGSVVAPAGAATMDIGFDFVASGASEEHDADELGLFINSLPLVWTAGGFVGLTTDEVQFSDDGVTWADVRYCSALHSFGANQQAQGYDEEAPFGVARSYRARVNATISGQVLSSPWSPVVTGTLSVKRCWFSIPDYQTGVPAGRLWAIPVSRVTPAQASSVSSGLTASLQVDQNEQQGVVWALGRSTAIVMRGTMQAEMPSITLQFMTDAAFQAFDAIRELQRTVLLRLDQSGERFYVALPPTRPAITLRASDRQTNPMRQLDLTDCTPVDAP